ncbi:MAG: S6e family ribosomal protein [Candidatus Pacearchaeota archaeon]
MQFKLDIGDPKSNRTVHIETNSDAFIGKKIGDTLLGNVIKEIPDFKDYEFVITGASDKAGFPALSIVEGVGRKRVLLTRGKGMRTKKPKGLRLRKLIRGNTIAEDIIQINLKVSKQGTRSFDEIFGKKEEKAEEKKESKEEIKKEGAEGGAKEETKENEKEENAEEKKE